MTGAKASFAVAVWTALAGTSYAGFPGSSLLGMFDSEIEVEVEGHRWERKITLERYQSKSFSDWCTTKKDNAYNVVYSRRERSSKRVEQRTAHDGKKYTYAEFAEFYGAGEKRDAGNGQAYSWSQLSEYYGKGNAEEKWASAKVVTPAPEVQEKVDAEWAKASTECEGACCPLCGTDKSFDIWCDYTADVWDFHETALEKGSDTYPYWPPTAVSDCTELGCIREASRKEIYYVDMSELKGGRKTAKTSCSLNHGGWTVQQWRSFTVGYRSHANRRPAWGLLCGSVVVPMSGLEAKRLGKDGKAYTLAEFIEYYTNIDARGMNEWKKAPPANEEL